MKLRDDRPTIDGEIQTSSMADIAFLLIIFFMLTLTFSASRGLDFAVPQEETPPTVIEPVEAVWVEVVPGGGLVVDRQPMALGELLGYLEPKLRANPSKPVVLAPSGDASYGDVVAVYDRLRTGREKLGLEHDIEIALPEKGYAERFDF